MCRTTSDPGDCNSAGPVEPSGGDLSSSHHHHHHQYPHRYGARGCSDSDSAPPPIVITAATVLEPAAATTCVMKADEVMLENGGRSGEKGVGAVAAAADESIVCRRRYSISEVAEEVWRLMQIAVPLILAGLLLYPRGMISMFFLGRMGGGEMELAGGSLAIAFANITGYSVLYGLALGMEPICGQAFGAGQWRLMAETTKKAMVGLLAASLPIAALWLNMERILLFCGQDPAVTSSAAIYLLYSLPDLAIHSILHPLRIHLRCRNITAPLSAAAAAALPLHLASNILLVRTLRLGIRGVALAAVSTNAAMLLFLLAYYRFSGHASAFTFFQDIDDDDVRCMAAAAKDWQKDSVNISVASTCSSSVSSSSSSGGRSDDDEDDSSAAAAATGGDASNYKILSTSDEDDDDDIDLLQQLPTTAAVCSSSSGRRRSVSWLWSAYWQEWGPLVRLAIPSCVSVCLEWWWYELMIMMAGLLDDAKSAVAAMGILIQITALIYIFPSSLGVAASTRVSNELGGNRPAAARLAARVACGVAAATGVAAAAFTVGVRDAWGRVFTGDADIRRLTAVALPVIGLCELGNGPQTAGCGVLRGSARPELGVKINLGAFYLVGAPVSVAAVFWAGAGFVGLWEGMLAAQLVCAVAMMLAVRRTDWWEEARRAKKLTGGGKTLPLAASKCGGAAAADEPEAIAVGEKQQQLLLVAVS